MSHPDIDRLLRSLGGTLGADEEAALKLHLDGCGSCRQEYRKLSLLMGTGDPASTNSRRRGSDAAEILPSIRIRIREWQARQSHGAAREDVKRRVIEELEPFLGQRGAAKLLQSVAEDSGDLLARLEPVLAAFLGDSAARDLVNRIVDSALLVKFDV